MSKILFKNLNKERGISITNHGDARMYIGPDEEVTMQLDNINGPYDAQWLNAFYKKYKDDLGVEVTVSLDTPAASGGSDSPGSSEDTE